MKQIQLVGITPEENNLPIFNYIDKKFDELKKFYQPKEQPIYLSRKETADLLKVDLSTLWNWQQKNILIPKGIGKRVLYERKDVEKAIVKLDK